MFAVGGVSLWADGHKDGQGYLSTATHGFATGGNALATDDLDVGGRGPDGLVGTESYGRVRQVASHTGKPVFVGVARADAVSSYLREDAGRPAHLGRRRARCDPAYGRMGLARDRPPAVGRCRRPDRSRAPGAAMSAR